jgi:C4-dicarboxylate transporter DctQ subunit
MKISLLKNKIAIKYHKIFDLLGVLLFALFCLFLIIKGYQICDKIKGFNQLSSSLRVPMYIPYLALPLGGIIMLTRIIQKSYDIITK